MLRAQTQQSANLLRRSRQSNRCRLRVVALGPVTSKRSHTLGVGDEFEGAAGVEEAAQALLKDAGISDDKIKAQQKAKAEKAKEKPKADLPYVVC